MKVLISVHVRWWNASAYYAVTAAEALRDRGHDVTVLAHRSTPACSEAYARGLPVIDDLPLHRSDPLAFMRNIAALRKLLRWKRYDIVNPHRPEDHFYLALAQRWSPAPARLVRTVSDVRSPHLNYINRKLHETWTDALVYCADICRRRYHDVFDLSHLPEEVIYSALDVERFTSGVSRDSHPYADYSRPVIGIVARLSPNKGHDILLRAAVDLLKEHPTTTILVVGKEEEVKVAELEAKAAEFGVESAVVFTGRLSDPRPAIAACDIGVIASTGSEVISRAAQEFFAFGVPVVATRVNVLPEMVTDGENGLLIDPGDPAQLSQALLRILDDPTLNQTLSQGAQESARERHDLPGFGERYESFLHSVLNR